MRQSERQERRIRAIFETREWLTAIILAVSLLVTHSLWKNAGQIAGQTLQAAFDFRVREANDAVQQRMQIYEQVLRATAGLFHASEAITREEFRIFIESLDLTTNYPGIQGIGFSVLIKSEDMAEHVASVRKEGFPDYEVIPVGERPLYSSIVYLEPFSGRNLRAFGYDMYSEPNRRAAMEKARDTGNAALSAKVKLVQEVNDGVQAGFLMYLPLYRNRLPHNTLEDRRANLIGWVYAPFRMDDFMHGLNGEKDNELDIEIYDESISDASRMYDAHPAVTAAARDRRLSSIHRIVSGSRTWTVATTALPAFEQRMQTDRPLLILQAGISISLMLALLFWLFLDDRARALYAAHQAMQLALYDTLTGLPNRKLLDERLGQALTKARRNRGRVALLFIDLDKFKPVNDNYGHAYGDLLLKDVARRLHDCMRESDTASRLGGDEFVALLPEVEDKPAAITVAKKVLTALSMPYEIAGHAFDISASIGVALYPDDASDGKSLMKVADLAMYEAKNIGRSTVAAARPGATHAA